MSVKLEIFFKPPSDVICGRKPFSAKHSKSFITSQLFINYEVESTRRSLCSDLCKFFLQFFFFRLANGKTCTAKNQKVKKVVMRTSKSVINFTNYYFSLSSFSTKRSNFFCINLNKFLLQKCLNWKLRTKQQQEQDPTNLYLANLPLTFKETDVEQLLAKYGQVISTRILRDQQGTSKGESRWLLSRHAGTN